MFSSNANHFSCKYTSPHHFPESVWDAMFGNPKTSNVILAYALKTAELERKIQAGRAVERPQNQLWITCCSHTSTEPTIDLVLSCIESSLGSLPVFICATCPSSELTPSYLQPRLEVLARALADSVPSDRVFSIFSPSRITRLFVDIWTRLTGVEVDAEGEYYNAKFMECTKSTFINRRSSTLDGLTIELQLAEERDIPQIAELCHGFAAESPPFTLTHEAAEREAKILVHNQQVWVHRIYSQHQPCEIASIAAVTREGGRVSAITKVYTNPKWRRRGCAERLVRQVCRDLLLTAKERDSVVLYVGHDLLGANKVYSRVGFSSVGESDSWLELGLDRSKVRLGHW